MTILFDDGLNECGTHVFLLGVGDYPFLEKGSSSTRFAYARGMGQLSSPPKSVEALSNWFCDIDQGYHNPACPLRSLEVLCSAKTAIEMQAPGGNIAVVERAATNAVVQSIQNWCLRASRNPENIAIFYYCGHGLSFGDAQNALLLENFGGNQFDPMDDAIAFDEFRLGLMQHCSARHQIHFVDACRIPPTNDFLRQYGPTSKGRAVLSGGLNRSIRDKAAPVYFATGLASAAYGWPDQPSLFTQGLLQALRGTASRDADQFWEVTISALAEGINRCVKSFAFQSQPQYCQAHDTGHDFMLHRLRKDPEIVVKVFTRNQTILNQAIFAYVRTNCGTRKERSPEPTPWWVALQLGEYRFEARYAASPGEIIGRCEKSIMPPGVEVGL